MRSEQSKAHKAPPPIASNNPAHRASVPSPPAPVWRTVVYIVPPALWVRWPKWRRWTAGGLGRTGAALRLPPRPDTDGPAAIAFPSQLHYERASW